MRRSRFRVATWEETLHYGARLPKGLRPRIGGGSGPTFIGSSRTNSYPVGTLAGDFLVGIVEGASALPAGWNVAGTSPTGSGDHYVAGWRMAASETSWSPGGSHFVAAYRNAVVPTAVSGDSALGTSNTFAPYTIPPVGVSGYLIAIAAGVSLPNLSHGVQPPGVLDAYSDNGTWWFVVGHNPTGNTLAITATDPFGAAGSEAWGQVFGGVGGGSGNAILV